MASRPQPYDHACVMRVTGTSAVDAAALPVPDSFYYLVGVENDCSAATAGLGSNSLAQVRPIPACP